MSRPTATDDAAVAILAKLRALRSRIATSDRAQRARYAERYDLAAEARAAGASWTSINEAAGVANMQATLAGKRPSVD